MTDKDKDHDKDKLAHEKPPAAAKTPPTPQPATGGLPPEAYMTEQEKAALAEAEGKKKETK